MSFAFCSPVACDEERTMFDMVIWFNRYNVIANPLEGKLTMPKAIFIVMLIWIYTIPWSVFPYLRLWGRYVPGMCRRSFVEVNGITLAIFSILPIRHTAGQRASSHHAHSTIWPTRLTTVYSSAHCSPSATVSRWCSSFISTAKSWATYSAMRKRCGRRPRKWTSNRCDRIRAHRRPKFA